MEKNNPKTDDAFSDQIDTKPIEENKSVENVAGLSISKIESDFFSKLRAEIKEGLSDSLDYSLLEDQVLPEMYESSPDVETKYKKRISTGLSYLLKNMTIYDNHNWEEDISDESFVRTEKLVRGSEYKIASSNKNNLVNISIDDENINDSLDPIKELNEKTSPEKILIEPHLNNFDENNSIRGSLKLDERNIIKEEAEKSINITHSVHDSLDSVSTEKSDDKFSSERINNSESSYISHENTEDSLDDMKEDSASDTLKFNDTLEEMEHFLTHGFQQKLRKPEPILKTPPVELPVLKKPLFKYAIESPVKTPIKIATRQYGKLPSRLNTPISQKPPKIKIADTKKLVSPACNLTPFKLPQKTNLVHKNFDPRSPMQRQAFLNHRLDRYENVVSPIKYYINNSPTVPMLKNVSPAKNYWDRAPPKNFNSKLKMPRMNLGKENSQLPEKAYKSPKVTNVIDRPSVKRLPKNNGVLAMAENLPKVVVIKHMKREKFNNDKRTVSPLMPSKNLDNNVNLVEDSFAHLPVKSMDISHCVGHQAGRSHTLK